MIACNLILAIILCVFTRSLEQPLLVGCRLARELYGGIIEVLHVRVKFTTE